MDTQQPDTQVFLTDDGFQIEFLKRGNGSKTLLLFHGYGRTLYDWNLLFSSLEQRFTTYSINLFYHEGSKFPINRTATQSLTKEELQDHIYSFCKSLNISNFDVGGYSLGGKIALTLLELFPNRIQNMWLFAPDGIQLNFWHQFATQHAIGNTLFKWVLQNPKTLIFAINISKKLGLVEAKTVNFYLDSISSKSKRSKLFNVWMAYRLTSPTMDANIKIVKENQVNVYQFYGTYDSIIPPKIGISYAQAIKQQKNVFILKCGHWLFRTKVKRKLELIVTEKGC